MVSAQKVRKNSKLLCRGSENVIGIPQLKLCWKFIWNVFMITSDMRS